RVGLITGESTAAYKDFTTRLSASPFKFTVVTAYAKMQGNDTESSVIAALDALRKDEEIDVVCIVRGGGAKTDLNYFDSEALCRAVANYPIPVFTGIGHEIDKSLLDEVAYLSCITPTDCAKRLVERAQESWTDLVETARSIASSARDMLTENRQRLSSAAARLQQDVTLRIQGEKTKIVRMFTSLERDTRFMLREETARLDRNVEGLRQGTRKILDLAQSQFKLTELRVKSADPETALAKGYTLTLDSSGKFIRNAAQLKSGDTLRTKFRDGTVESVVQ
ncbi:MAG: exodeoxyribonuclease VII large subunit, partial [Fibrobacter sp.]|nr:exodeoxyribonuclease VII large subunit [Fibrobacter sp.]